MKVVVRSDNHPRLDVLKWLEENVGAKHGVDETMVIGDGWRLVESLLFTNVVVKKWTVYIDDPKLAVVFKLKFS